MKVERMLQVLEAAAEQLHVEVKYEPIISTVGSGGLCKVKGEYRAIIDRRANTADRFATLARALAQLDTSAVDMPKPVREVVDRYAAEWTAGRRAS